MSTTIFALVLPILMAIVAGTFMVLSRFNLPAAFAWGLGFGFCAAGFTTSIMLVPATLAALVSDLFFIAGFYFYAEAFLIHFAMPLFRRERIAFAAIYLIMNAYVVLRIESLHLELLLNDVATSCLLGFALVRVMHHARTIADRAAVLTGSVVVIDTLIRVLAFVYFANASDRLEDFAQSSYAQAMQVTTAIVGLFYALSIAAALADRAIRQLHDVAERDPLTGLLNRRGFARSMEAAGVGGRLAGAILTCDIDHFKQVNDRHGHAAGDRVIQTLALALGRCLPGTAVSARFGGEEFVTFLPNTSLAEAGILAQGLRARFAAQDWRAIDIDRQITASFGVAAIADGDDTAWPAITRADRALYEAKAAGRNKVVWDGGNYEPGAVVVDIQQSAKDEARRSVDNG
ncbi:MAG: GGDEF domain-containing protein [Rhizobium sp.]|nr:GGDEF domain-containing protein [Rhizobium sp.]